MTILEIIKMEFYTSCAGVGHKAQERYRAPNGAPGIILIYMEFSWEKYGEFGLLTSQPPSHGHGVAASTT